MHLCRNTCRARNGARGTGADFELCYVDGDVGEQEGRLDDPKLFLNSQARDFIAQDALDVSG